LHAKNDLDGCVRTWQGLWFSGVNAMTFDGTGLAVRTNSRSAYTAGFDQYLTRCRTYNVCGRETLEMVEFIEAHLMRKPYFLLFTQSAEEPGLFYKKTCQPG